MSVTHKIIELNNTEPVAISVTGHHAGRDITVQNISTTENVYIGGENVSTTNFGYKISPNAAWSVELPREDILYAVSDSTSNVAILELGLESFN